jgi:hypothetical protein
VEALNPFIVSYLTEGSLTAQELLQRYSFEPIQYLHQNLASNNNVFLIGRPGVGKTMLLKIFEPDLMALLFESNTPEHIRVRNFLPAGTVGVYLNLASPDSRLDQFQGRLYANGWWLNAYADYLNSFLFDQACFAVEAMFGVAEWRHRNDAKTSQPFELPQLSVLLMENLRKESASFEQVGSIAELRVFLQERLQQWSRFTNNDEGAPEPKVLFPRLGRPLFHLVNAIRRSGLLGAPFRLFVIVDQYESLYSYREIIDYRPIFNEAIRAASRGGTGIEFKIGSRQYAYKNFELPGKSGKIEIGREAIEINLDAVAENFYGKLAKDVFQKRMSPFLAGVRANELEPRKYLPGLRPTEEASLYAGDEIGLAKHLSPFERGWRGYGFSEVECKEIVGKSGLRETNALAGTLACIAITRWLRRGRQGEPVGCDPIIGSFSDVEKMVFHLKVLLSEIQTQIDPANRPTIEVQSNHKTSVENFVHDATVPALFQLASYYKNLRRYFSGFETVVRLSSNVAVVLIELLQAIYERAF